jgi:hypothetical protein
MQKRLIKPKRVHEELILAYRVKGKISHTEERGEIWVSDRQIDP